MLSSLKGYYTIRFRLYLMNGDVIELIHIAVEKEAKAAPVISMFFN
jgi:hypothetical protein